MKNLERFGIAVLLATGATNIPHLFTITEGTNATKLRNLNVISVRKDSHRRGA